jgi:hypothetical protein
MKMREQSGMESVVDSESNITSQSNIHSESTGADEHSNDPMDLDDDNWIDNDTEDDDDPLPRNVRKAIHTRSKHGTEKRLLEKAKKTKVNFYKEKGAADMAYLKRLGKDTIPDIDLEIYPQRRVSRIDLEKSMSFALRKIRKSTLSAKIFMFQ